jgi:hypothetical protein
MDAENDVPYDFWILDSLLLYLLLVAPAVVVILTSLVGRMLAG